MDLVEHRNGRLYLIGLAASLIGNSAMTLVAGIWVKSLTGSSGQAGLVSALTYAPTLAAPVAGLVADRVDRRRWLVVVNVVSAATILSLLGVRSAGETWLIDVAMAIYGLEAVLLDPAENALFAEIFGDEGEISEDLFEAIEERLAGRFDPVTVYGGWLIGSNGPEGFEAAEVVEADEIVERQ